MINLLVVIASYNHSYPYFCSNHERFLLINLEVSLFFVLPFSHCLGMLSLIHLFVLPFGPYLGMISSTQGYLVSVLSCSLLDTIFSQCPSICMGHNLLNIHGLNQISSHYNHHHLYSAKKSLTYACSIFRRYLYKLKSSWEHGNSYAILST